MKKIISFVVVVLNSEKSILNCLSSILEQGIDLKDLEVIIVDGNSKDNTVAVCNKFFSKNKMDFIIINNPKKTLSTGWNLAIKQAKGKYIVRPDAHAVLNKNYIANGINKLEENKEFSAVGGVLETKSTNFLGAIIATVLSNPIGVGPSLFRIGLKKDVESDTVVYGVYRKTVFDEVGLFNENLGRNQDIEFHKRVKSKQLKMLTSPDLKADYYSRSDLKSFVKQAYHNGLWVGKGYGHFRHFIPLFFFLTLITSFIINLKIGFLFIGFYAFAVLLSYLYFSKLWHPIKLIISIILTFLLHISYGFGTLIGKLKLK